MLKSRTFMPTFLRLLNTLLFTLNAPNFTILRYLLLLLTSRQESDTDN